jgi:M6 family metalloprotease-like protein
MRPVFAIPTAFLLVSVGVFGYLNPDVVNGWLDDFQPIPVIEDESLVSFQENESWLIVVVDFDSKPASPGLDVTQAENLLSGDYGLPEFISQLSGDSVNLSLTFYPDEIRALNSISFYGRDSGDTRDTGESGSDGPSTLAGQVVSDLSDEIDWSIFDLNDDGVVDRFLILHTSKPQEDNGGSDRIWSHFGPLMDPIEVGGGLTVEHYTMASLRSTNYRGTIYHEMLHQLGALDLYSVHDQFRSDPWNGVGEWDLMASGNWNGNGAIPGLPMAATIDLLGLERYTETVNWPTVQSCANISINLQPQNSASFRSAHRIELSDGEWLWLEYRDNSGFDSRLPGEGTLVSIQNDNVDGFERNLVNTDSRDAWLKVIEADQDDGLIRGVDDGSSGDTFQVGDTLGNQGIQIRNRFGKLVDWQISIVESLSSSGVQLILSSENCSPSFTSGFLDEKLVVLPGESVPLTLQTEVDCQPIIDLTSSDGRPFLPESQTEVVSAGQEATFTLVWSGVALEEQKGTIAGNISCGDGPSIDYLVPWFTVGNEPTATEFSSNVPILNPSTVSIPLGIEGPVSREYLISIEGALARIASTSDVVTFVEGDELVLEIEPNGLLSNGMIARGEVVLSDTNGNSYSIDITLRGEAIEGSGDLLSIIRTPSTMLLIVCCLTALWVLLGIARKESEEGKGGYTEGVPQGGYTNYSPAEQHYSPTMQQIPLNSQSETSRSPVEVQYFDDTPRF